jgi:hypothetical protein
VAEQNHQRFIVDLPAGTARNVLSFLSKGSGYADLSELIAVALENQLRLEEGSAEPGDAIAIDRPHDVWQAASGARSTAVDGNSSAGTKRVDLAVASRMKARQPAKTTVVRATGADRGSSRTTPRSASHKSSAKAGKLAKDRLPAEAAVKNKKGAGTNRTEEDAGPVAKMDAAALLGAPDVRRVVVGPPNTPAHGMSLTPFTNRINPLVIPLRVLANATVMLDRVAINDFVRSVPRVAREVGIRLKAEDDARARRGRERRWTAWPVGPDEDASLNRFRNSFLFKTDSRGEAGGPLVDLGLATVSDRLLLTSRGLEIAADKTPLLGETGDDSLLSDRQCELFREALLSLPGERSELRLFLDAIAKSGGDQAGVDDLIQQAHPTWTGAQVISHRAAMIGRLRDVGLVDAMAGQAGHEVLVVLEPHSKSFREALKEGND